MAIYNYRPASPFVTLTWDTATAAILGVASSPVCAAFIERIDTVSGGAQITVTPNGGAFSAAKNLVTTSTPSAVSALTGIHILLTPYDTTQVAFYINALQVTGVQEATTYRTVTYNSGGFDKSVNVSETLSALITALNAAIPADYQSVITVAAAGTNQATATSVDLKDGETNLVIITGADSVKGVKADAFVAGTTVKWTVSGSNSLYALIYPPTGGTIGELGANLPYVLHGGESIEMTIFADGAALIDEGQTVSSTVAAAGSAFGDCARFFISANTDNDVNVTGADGTKGVGFSLASPDGTRANVVNLSGSDLLLYPLSGGDFGLGVNVPLIVDGNSSVLLVARSGQYYADTTQVMSTAGSFQLVGSANSAFTGLKNTAADELSLIAAGVEAINVQNSVITNNAPLNLEGAIYEATALPGTDTFANNIVVDTVATEYDAIVVPADANFINVLNNGVNTLSIVNAAGSNVGYLLRAQSGTWFKNPSTGAWTLTSLQGGTQNGTASTTQTQAAGTLIQSAGVNASTVANAGDAFTISKYIRAFTFFNNGANDAQVFPPSGGTIDGGAANASITVTAATDRLFVSNNGLDWLTITV